MTDEYEVRIESSIFVERFKKMLLQATIAQDQANYVRSKVWHEQFNIYPT